MMTLRPIYCRVWWQKNFYKTISYCRETRATLYASRNIVNFCANNASRQTACQSEEHFQQLSVFIWQPADLYTHRCTCFNYRTSSTDTPCHIHVMLKWAVHVMNKLHRRPTLLMIALNRARGHRGRWIQTVDLKHLSRRLHDRWKKQNFYPPTCIWWPRWEVVPWSEFRRDVLHHKTRVHELLWGVIFVILATLVQHRLVTDRRTNTGPQHIPR